MRRVFLLLACLAAASLAGCRSGPSWLGGGWTREEPEAHAALQEDRQLVRLTRGRGDGREARYELVVDARDVEIDSVDELVPHCGDLLDPETAIAYADLIRRVRPSDAGVAGDVILPDPLADGPGGSGTYTREDAARWGMEFGARARRYAGGVEVTIVVLYAPAKHPDLKYYSPYRLVEQSETVYPDGTLSIGDVRTLTNGEDAQRFDVY